MTEESTHYRTCNICEAMCGLEIQHEGTQILSIKGDVNDPFSQGHICPKAVALQDFYHDPDRLKTPVRRTNSGWKSISWDEAFDEVIRHFSEIQNAFGKDALGLYLGNPNAHNFGNALFLKPFIRSLGTMNRYSSASADQLPHHVASNTMLGSSMLIPIPDIDHTDMLLIIGANPIVSNGSMMTAPNIKNRLKDIKKRGGKIVVIDPRRTETAKVADEYIPIKPEQDALLLLAMIDTVFKKNLVSLGHLSESINGIATLQEVSHRFPSSKVSMATGIDTDTIERLAIEMANATSSVCYSRMGASTQSFGGLCQWLTNAFNIITGNFDSSGGAMFTQPAFDLIEPKKSTKRAKYNPRVSRVAKYPFLNGEFPVATLKDEISTPGEGQIKALITIAGNPVLSSPGGHLLEGALKTLDFMVSIDPYINETTRHAHIILPPTVALENSHYDIFFNTFSIRNTAKYSQALFPQGEEQRQDWQILNELTSRIKGVPLGDMTPESILDYGLKNGTYGKNGMSLLELTKNPHGIDLGPLKTCLLDRILTESNNIEIAPQFFTDDIERLAKSLHVDISLDSNYPFKLISRRLVRSHNTWTQNSKRLVKGKNPCTLEIHPEDAEKLNIQNGQNVCVSSATGNISIPTEITDDICKGVVSIPQGWGHNKKNSKLSVAQTQPGVSINDLTDPDRIDLLTGNAALNGTPVNITTI